MGKYIVQKQKHLGERSSLWNVEDFKEVTMNNKMGDAKFGVSESNKCRSLEEVHHSLGCSRKLIELNLCEYGSLERFPCVNAKSLDLD
ncbi:hypothetical protein H5410_061960 [Solanum commersonii]|uniref:Uncharacterized protein n=1 Tax=Solanum commersonii TaxID=4109 RepID=A0A9J5W9G5_SOLCO|nr:hypothetical protein H5410_061960 [Solanum commersonii]